ncbi:MAG: 50S ribosomal protein L22 [Candidatus Taylorbacteria bacterium]
MKASLNDYRQSPRKVRLVANFVKGKKVSQALSVLNFMTKDAAQPIKKLIDSALANAKNNSDVSSDFLFIKDIQVNPGAVLKRRMPRARGTAFQIKKRTSHITIVLEEKTIVNSKSEARNPKKKEAKQLIAKS